MDKKEDFNLFSFLGIDPKNPLFGANPDDPDFAKTLRDFMNSKNKGSSDRPTLLNKFNDLLKKKDKKTLEKEVCENSYQIHIINAPDLFRVHAIASLFVSNYDLAFVSLNKITRDYDNIDELMGIISYSKKKFTDASVFFQKVGTPFRPQTTLIVKAISDWHSGETDIYKHEFDLEPVIEKSKLANTFLGILFYNVQLFEKAQDYFVNAVIFNEKNERTRLNSLRTIYQINKQSAENQFGKFLYDTQSQLSPEKLESEMQKIQLEIPYFKIHAVHTLAEKLL